MKIKLWVIVSALLISFGTMGQTSEEEAIKEVINEFFEGMNTSDVSKLQKNISVSAVFHGLSKSIEIKSESIPDFISSIGKSEKGSLEERIVFDKILIDGPLASVWTPYEFYIKGKFSHCGVNSFQLVKEKNENWKIVYIIDTRRKDNCHIVKTKKTE